MPYSPFRHIGSVFWKRRPIQLTFFLTRRCNSRCRFCFYLSEGDQVSEKNEELTCDEIQKISSSMGSLLWLAFSGGEIFLRNDLADIAGIFYRQNRPSIMLFPTNGLLTERIYETIRAILDQCGNSTIVVKLSLDGPEQVHEQIRGVKGSYRQVLETYRRLAELLPRYPHFELGINSVFCKENQDVMGEVIEFVKGMDAVKTHTVSLIRGEGLARVDMEKYRECSETLARNLRGRGAALYRFRGARLKAAQDIVQRRLIYETETMKEKRASCYAGKLNLVLTEEGTLYPCESFASSMKLGNLRESGYDVNRVVHTEKAQKIINAITGRGCFCSHECYLMTNILFDISLYPRVLREYLKLQP